MQKSFHVNRKYDYLIPFLDEKPNVSKYLCELIALDYANELKSIDTIQLAELVSNNLEFMLNTKIDEKLKHISLQQSKNAYIESMELANSISDKVGRKVTQQVEERIDQIIKMLFRTLTTNPIQQQDEGFISSFEKSRVQESLNYSTSVSVK